MYFLKVGYWKCTLFCKLAAAQCTAIAARCQVEPYVQTIARHALCRDETPSCCALCSFQFVLWHFLHMVLYVSAATLSPYPSTLANVCIVGLVLGSCVYMHSRRHGSSALFKYVPCVNPKCLDVCDQDGSEMRPRRLRDAQVCYHPGHFRDATKTAPRAMGIVCCIQSWELTVAILTSELALCHCARTILRVVRLRRGLR